MQRTRAPSRHPMCECVTHSRQSHSAQPQAPRGEGVSPASATASGARRLPQQHYTMCYSRRVTQSAVCYGLCGVLCSCELCYAVRVYLHVVFWLLCYACIILRVIIIISPSPHLMLALHSPVQYYNSQRHGYIHSTYVVMRSITRDGCCGNSAVATSGVATTSAVDSASAAAALAVGRLSASGRVGARSAGRWLWRVRLQRRATAKAAAAEPPAA